MTAMAQQYAITMVDDYRSLRPSLRTMTLCVALEVNRVLYVVAHCHQHGGEKTFRMDCIRECWIEEEATVL